MQLKNAEIVGFIFSIFFTIPGAVHISHDVPLTKSAATKLMAGVANLIPNPNRMTTSMNIFYILAGFNTLPTWGLISN